MLPAQLRDPLRASIEAGMMMSKARPGTKTCSWHRALASSRLSTSTSSRVRSW